MKRAFDVVAAGCGLLVLSPVLLLIAAAVKSGDMGPVFFRQQRVGRDGRPFGMWKFRTMVVDAEKLGPFLTADHDPRITRVGRWLRTSRLDELPQLFNVLVGDMSIVGPRPEVPYFVDRYTSEQRRVLCLVPGITDPASIRFLDEAALLDGASQPEQFYVDRIMPEKIRLNLDYASRATLATDAGVILQTIARLMR